MALSVGVGLGVLSELMEEDVVRHESLSHRAGWRPRRLPRWRAGKADNQRLGEGSSLKWCGWLADWLS